MTLRLIATGSTVVGMILAMWSGSSADAVKKHVTPPHHRKHTRITPGPRPVDAASRPSTSARPEPKAKAKGTDSPTDRKPATADLDRKHRGAEARLGEARAEDRKAGARADRRAPVSPGATGGGPRTGGMNPPRREHFPNPDREQQQQQQQQAAKNKSKASALPPRPNLLVLLLDDQDDNTPYWEAMPQTAGMVNNGLRFKNAFSPTPICSPGRCTFLTGRLAHNTGVFTLSGPHGPAAFGGQASTEFSVGLSNLGYINGYFGKTWGPDSPNPGWQRWCAVGGDNMYTGYGYQVTNFSSGGSAAEYTSGQYVTDFLADQAVEFLQSHVPSGQPFCVCLAPTAPHLPLPPAPRDIEYARLTWKDKLPRRPNYNEHDVHDKSRWLREQATVRSECVPYAEHEYDKRMGSLMAVDQMMGRIRSLLIEQGKWENTIVVFTSDNGYNLGAHRLIHKMAPYEESIHVPLYVAGPGIAAGEITRMVGLHDVAPTLIQLAGGQAPANMDGKPLGAFLTTGSDGADPKWRTALLTEYDSGGVHAGFNPGGAMTVGWELDIPTYRSVRTDTKKYILWLTTGEEEVYDLVNDPFELTNLTRVDPTGVGPLHNQLASMLAAVRGCEGGGCP